MNSICPLCNGFTSLSAICPNCGAEMSDAGRLSDLNGPYSPYRPIDDLKKTNGYPDLQHKQCIHVGFCAYCGHQELHFIQELEK